jgi:tRNA-splicing ligase RtcB (3'-phosphate/5'-hydroxy nucleic acid ligase)
MANYEVLNEEGGVHIKAWTKGVPFEDEAKKQLIKLSKLPFLFKHLAVMPDVHAGKGSTVGSVIATRQVIIPATVGVDIGCGMIAVKTDLKASDLPDSLAEMRSAIEAAVPHGGPGDVGSWKCAPEINGRQTVWPDMDEYNTMCFKYPDIESKYVSRQFGTLGTGNHFVEVCLDEFQNVWVMLHSGSRGAGNRIGTFFIEKAKEEMKRWFINLPDQDLAYLPEGSEYYLDYLKAVGWAQHYAEQSREVMLENTLFAMAKVLDRTVETFNDTAVNCHHNYVAKENHFGQNVWVTRKGAVRARLGDMGIIPGSMGARSYIVRGKGNKDAFESCSHGAGRKMSRTEAKRTFSLADHAKATEGVECRKDADVIDETPGAYKSIDNVMAAQYDLVEPVAILKAVLCVKG